MKSPITRLLILSILFFASVSTAIAKNGDDDGSSSSSDGSSSSSGSSSSEKGNPFKGCTKEAKGQHLSCLSECKITRDQAILNCKVPEGDCGDECSAAYVDCVAPFISQKENCQDACEATYETARTACGVTCSCTPGVDCGSQCFGACMDEPTVDRAKCRTTCVRQSTYRNGIKACGRVLRLCSKGCDE